MNRRESLEWVFKHNHSLREEANFIKDYYDEFLKLGFIKEMNFNGNIHFKLTELGENYCKEYFE